MLTEANLHPYQRAGVDYIIDNARCALFLDMGLGKTVTTLTAIVRLLGGLEVCRVLVIGTKRIIEDVWPLEAKQWQHTAGLRVSVVSGSEAKRKKALATPADIYCISRDNVAWLCALYGGLKLPFDMLVVDESSSFKNHSAGRFKSLKRTLDSFARVVILTGTPAPRSLLNLWPQIYLLDKGQRLGRNITAYREAYFRKSFNGFGFDALGDSETIIMDKIKDIAMSMKASDYLSLPPVVYNEVLLRFDEKQAKEYTDFERSMVLQLKDVEISTFGAGGLVNKLAQYANGSVYDENKTAHVVHSLKIDALADIVEASDGKPILLAYEFQSDRDRILERFKFARQLKTSDDVTDWNAGRVSLLIAHPASAAHGLNLQFGGSTIVWYSPTWDLELYLQMNTRLNRQGQKNNVVINILAVDGTIDNRKLKSLQEKSTQQESVMAAVKFLMSKHGLSNS